MRTALTELLAIDHPVLLAPMGGVSGGALARAVSEAGGLGLIGAGYGDADWLAREMALCTDCRFGVGFITWALHQRPELLDLALAQSPAAILFSFGDCRDYVPRVHAAGARVICQVGSVTEAERAAQDGADLIVAQGTEGGGHGGGRSTFALTPAVVDAVAPIPVVAAGGVADGRGLAAALMLGATGVLVGTRFYASREALGLEAAKQAIVTAGGDATLRTRVFDIVRGYDWPGGYTGRVIGNRFTETWHGREAELTGEAADERRRYHEAVARGDAETAVLFAGEAIDLIRAVEPAGTIVARLIREAETVLAGTFD
ncbi:nitronate monooxygenase [Salinisphaera sp.]|uniref:NAD(P)H-dependent flavin oxidoreductase n=1 Tax=Salinisphaera sp. TaxID=1914330 RepID=UPI002D7A3FA0|nr:nitronate monooxygenase [Salinisphaera sp.]HET7314618.1 nitronate monooxygenase [Salinisphaera sp.]